MIITKSDCNDDFKSLWNQFLSRVSAADLPDRVAPLHTGLHPQKDDNYDENDDIDDNV